MKTVLVDTGAWLALLSRNDEHADHAAMHYRALSAAGTRLVTTNYVVDETATRLRYGAGLQAALAFRGMLNAAAATRRLKMAWIDERLERDGWMLLEQYADVTLSLTDATTVAVAKKRKITELFSFDRDFEATGLLVMPLR